MSDVKAAFSQRTTKPLNNDEKVSDRWSGPYPAPGHDGRWSGPHPAPVQPLPPEGGPYPIDPVPLPPPIYSDWPEPIAPLSPPIYSDWPEPIEPLPEGPWTGPYPVPEDRWSGPYPAPTKPYKIDPIDPNDPGQGPVDEAPYPPDFPFDPNDPGQGPVDEAPYPPDVPYEGPVGVHLDDGGFTVYIGPDGTAICGNPNDVPVGIPAPEQPGMPYPGPGQEPQLYDNGGVVFEEVLYDDGGFTVYVGPDGTVICGSLPLYPLPVELPYERPVNDPTVKTVGGCFPIDDAFDLYVPVITKDPAHDPLQSAIDQFVNAGDAEKLGAVHIVDPIEPVPTIMVSTDMPPVQYETM